MGTRLGALRGKADTAKQLAYRMEVRLGVVLRMRTNPGHHRWGRLPASRHGTRAERARRTIPASIVV